MPESTKFAARWTAIQKELPAATLKIIMLGDLKPHVSIDRLKNRGDLPPTCGASDADGVIRYCWHQAKDVYETK